jgi:sugar phosphate isomerase/epimerase
MISRRGLLAGLAAAGAGLRLSVVTDEVAFTEDEGFAFCKQYELGLCELRNVPGTKRGYWTLGAAEQRTLAGRLRGEGLQVSFIDSGLLAAPLPGTVPVKTPGAAEAGRFAGRMEELDRVLELAVTVGAPAVRCFALRRVGAPVELFGRIADVIAPMAERAGRAGVKLALENESSCNVATTAELVAFAKLVGSRWFGLNWDPGNAAHVERAYPDAYGLLPVERLVNVQVKGKGILPGGADPVDWAGILRALRRDGYRGPVGLETHTPARQADSHPAIRELIRLTAGV